MLQSIVINKIIGILSRHGMSAFGVWLLANGYADENTVEQITGGGLAAVTVLLSIGQKYIDQKKFLGFIPGPQG